MPEALSRLRCHHEAATVPVVAGHADQGRHQEWLGGETDHSQQERRVAEPRWRKQRQLA